MGLSRLAMVLSGMIALSACQNTGNTGRVIDRNSRQTATTQKPISVENVPIVSQEKIIKIGVFWRSHSQNLERQDKLTYAYWVLYSTSWANQKGKQLTDPFAVLGYPIYRTLGDEAITDEAMNRFLNFMLSQKLNELPSRSEVHPTTFQNDGKNIVALYVETPQARKIVFADDVARDPERRLAFSNIFRNFVKLCNEAHVTYVGASVDEQHDWTKPVPQK